MFEDQMYEALTALFIGIFAGGLLSLIYQSFTRVRREKLVQKEAARILTKAQSEARRIESKAKFKSQEWESKARQDIDKKMNLEKKKVEEKDRQLQKNKAQYEMEQARSEALLRNKEKNMERQKLKLEEDTEKLKALHEQKKFELEQLSSSLEEVSKMSKTEAEEELKKLLEKDLRSRMAGRLKEIEEEMIKESMAKTKNILASALARHASSVVLEQTTASVSMVSGDVKGKIIGREGRNIRALEHSCGVDILIEEGQDSVTISCFDAVRRHIAKTVIERLIKDGRIHPARIEEMVKKVKEEIHESMKVEGEQVCFDLGLHNLHPEILKTLGSLKYKVVGGKNVLSRSVDLAFLAGHIMAEVQGDESEAKRAALLHAIGLAVDHRIEGHYAKVGSEFAKKHREPPAIVQAVLCHNSKVKAESLLDHVVQQAFNLHQSLPVLKKDNIENFISRMKNLESIANSFSGVIRSFAMQSGKEIRVLVDSSQVTDSEAEMLCSDIARKIEREVNPSYQLKISVLRESRIIEHAH